MARRGQWSLYYVVHSFHGLADLLIIMAIQHVCQTLYVLQIHAHTVELTLSTMSSYASSYCLTFTIMKYDVLTFCLVKDYDVVFNCLLT